MAESGAMPTPEELAEQIRALRIDDILLTTVTTLGQLAYAKLEAEQLDQARLAIDGIAALLPVLEGSVRPEVLRDFNQLLAIAKLMIVYGGEDQIEFARSLWRQQITFYFAVFALRCRLALYPMITGTWDVGNLVVVLERMRDGLNELVPVEHAAL